MTNPTDKYLVIRSFLDNKGNSYQSRKEPYLYGELPFPQKDNTMFCVPLEITSIEEKVLTKENKEIIGNPNNNRPIEYKLKQVEIKTEEIKEETFEEYVVEKEIPKKEIIKPKKEK